MDTIYDWDGDWRSVDDPAERDAIGRELQHELSPDHLLYRRDATAIGRCETQDDVLFLLEDGQFAQVHLTWQQEMSPDWPSTTLFSSFDAWKAVPPDDR